MLLKPLAVAGIASMVLAAAGGPLGRGCDDTKTSLTDLAYPPYRDMRRTVVLNPQKIAMRAPDSSSVPMTGFDREIPLERRAAAERLGNPVPSDETSIERGTKTYKIYCTPCHGPSMAGDGPVAQFFVPPPDLLGQAARARSDGFIYAYIRFGGAVMPKYGQSISASEAWDLINYLRHMQSTSPR